MAISIFTLNTTEYQTIIKTSKFQIIYGIHSSPFGKCLIGILNNKNIICHLWFFDGNSLDKCLEIMAKEWPNAELIEGTQITSDIIRMIFTDKENIQKNNLSILLKGTEFQISVWKALMKFNKGKKTTYSEIAEYIGNPKAIRAVATAIAKNRIAYLIPCHRIVPKNGSIGKYRWGSKRKSAILNYEKE